MSKQRQAPNGDPVANSREISGFLRKDCRVLRDSLQLEMAVAQYELRLREVRTPEGIPIADAASAGVIADLERHADPLSHAILRAFAYLGGEETAQRSADAVARLAERGVGLTKKFGDVGAAAAVGAWRDTRGAHPGEYALFIDFEHPLGARHCLALFVEPGGSVKHLGLIQPMSQLGLDGLEVLEIAEASELLQQALARSVGAPHITGDFRALIAGARSRAMHASASRVSAA